MFPLNLLAAIIEAIEAMIIKFVTEGIPVLDMFKVKQALNKGGSRLIGPNTRNTTAMNAK